MIDDIDAGIIRLLGEDGRLSNKKLAVELGVSEPTIASRIRALLADGIVRVVAQRNAREDREHALVAIVELYLHDPADLAEAERAVFEFEPAISAYTTSRRPEICAWLRADSPPALNDLVLELARRVPRLSQLNTLPVLDVHRYRSTIVNLRHPPIKRAEPRDVGEALLALIEADGRQSIRSLATRLGLSETAIHHRLNKLLSETSTRIVLVADAEALGYHVWCDIRVTIAPGDLEQVMDQLAEHPDITIISHLAGSANLQIFVAARSVQDLDRFVTDHVRPMPGLVDFTLMRVPSVIRYDINYVL